MNSLKRYSRRLQPGYKSKLLPEDLPKFDCLVTGDDAPVDSIFSEKQIMPLKHCSAGKALLAKAQLISM